MADNPNKKREDGKRISQQKHEQAYQKRKAAKKGTTTKKAAKKTATKKSAAKKSGARRTAAKKSSRKAGAR